MTSEPDFDYDRLISRLLMMTAYAVVWPARQGDPASGASFRAQADRLGELLELRLLQGFADVSQNDLLVLTQLLGVLSQLVEEIRGNWDELRTLSDIYE